MIDNNQFIHKKFNKLTVLSLNTNPTSKYRIQFVCQCDCGNITIVDRHCLTGGSTKSCGCWKRVANKFYKSIGHEEISGSKFCSIKNSATIRKLPFDITIKDIWELFIFQNRKCAISDIELTFNSNLNTYEASLDRIDSSKGYIIGNIQWVYRDINFIKWILTEEELFKWSLLIVQYVSKQHILTNEIFKKAEQSNWITNNIKNYKDNNFKVALNDKFYRLTTVELSKKRNNTKYWKCLCECGNYCDIKETSLKSGHTKSCGCLNKRIGSENPCWKGEGELGGSYIKSIYLGAKKKEI